MAVITLETRIHAPRERVFDLARSIDAHQDSATGTSERAIGGITSGLLALGQEVTWRARHFGIVQHLTVRITRFDRPNYFQDVMLQGAFRSMCHDHTFEESEGVTVMRDRFEFLAPLGVLGCLAEWLFLTSYMRRFLTRRNAVLKQIAESDAWTRYLSASQPGNSSPEATR